ncbi:response regulator transcription factor [Uliginosibacterium aquaticum]|uniref:Response regulator transcription factor n=1 Tax=Uliginosibacterium aquaticum TaxID=2731212 RepID=A0ABX2IPQ8_9RHOO|nr:response regulator transcription factor [Uliginosibacterium aquaticum]NSL56679.1 response regulator transcription factor [Uliginosibacterium aquaticum]
MPHHEFSILTDDETVFARFRLLADQWVIHRLSGAASIPRQTAGSLIVIDSNAHALPAPGHPDWQSWSQQHKLIVASSLPSDDEGLAFLEAGVSGYCQAYAPPATLSQVLEVVASGEQWVGRSLLTRLLRGLNRQRAVQGEDWSSRLSEREREVARLAASGESNLFIAGALNITERTVKAHLSACFNKLDVTDRLQLALKVHGLRP